MSVSHSDELQSSLQHVQHDGVDGSKLAPSTRRDMLHVRLKAAPTTITNINIYKAFKDFDDLATVSMETRALFLMLVCWSCMTKQTSNIHQLVLNSSGSYINLTYMVSKCLCVHDT